MTTFLPTQAIDTYDDLLARHEREVVAEVERYRSHHPRIFAANEMRLRPFMLEDAHYQSIQQDAARVARAVLNVAERLLDERDARRALSIPDYVEPLLEMEPRSALPTILARLDGHLLSDGRPQFIEYNSAAAGVSESDILTEMLDGTVVAKSFFAEFPFASHHLAEEGRQALLRQHAARDRSGVPTVAVLRGNANIAEGAYGSGYWLCHAAAKLIPVLRVGADELSFDGHHLRAEGEAIDVIAFMREHLLRQPCAALFEAIRAGAVQVMHGLGRSMVASTKAVFAVLSDPHFDTMFPGCSSPEVRALVPWTRRLVRGSTTHDGVTVDLIEHIARHRQKFVIKPDIGVLGKGVVIGRSCDDETWVAALEAALDGPSHIVQAFVPPLSLQMPVWRDGQVVREERQTDLDPYIWNGDRPGGAVVRYNAGASLELSGPGLLGTLWRIMR